MSAPTYSREQLEQAREWLAYTSVGSNQHPHAFTLLAAIDALLKLELANDDDANEHIESYYQGYRAAERRVFASVAPWLVEGEKS